MANLSILEKIEKIYLATKEKGFSKELLLSHKRELNTLAKYYGLKDSHAYWLSVIFYYNIENDTNCTFNELKEMLKITPVVLIKQMEEIDYLVANEFLVKKKKCSNSYAASKLSSVRFSVHSDISDAIIHGDKIQTKQAEKIETLLDAVEIINTWVSKLEDKELDVEGLINKYKQLKEETQFSFFSFLKANNTSVTSELFLFHVIWQSLCGNYSVDGNEFYKVFFKNEKDKVRFVQSLLNKRNELTNNDLIEQEELFFPGDAVFILTQKVKIKLKEENIFFTGSNSANFDLISPEKIVSKKLILPINMAKTYKEIANVLNADYYNQLMLRLEQKALPTSLSILFYGSPGTGKTEMVYQLAKQTGREVIKVNISDVKSKWYGDSEKLVKRIFTDYRELAKGKLIKPILLLNEADAIISKRFENLDNSMAFSLNAIQNIILEEMERFDGVLIATTNLEKNFDTAFERRFLYKIAFEKPGKAEQKELWETKLGELDRNTQISTLVDEFDFTGAQIENVVRRTEVHSVLYNKPLSLEMLKSICNEEEVGFNKSNKTVQIGFQK
jgi:Cdc6-like AAA superfamily ATPase